MNVEELEATDKYFYTNLENAFNAVISSELDFQGYYNTKEILQIFNVLGQNIKKYFMPIA